jgi:hypothetical protein
MNAWEQQTPAQNTAAAALVMFHSQIVDQQGQQGNLSDSSGIAMRLIYCVFTNEEYFNFQSTVPDWNAADAAESHHAFATSIHEHASK